MSGYADYIDSKINDVKWWLTSKLDQETYYEREKHRCKTVRDLFEKINELEKRVKELEQTKATI